MVISEKDVFSFTWIIENFSMCPILPNEYMDSPTFTVYGGKWRLSIQPREHDNENYVGCYLEIISFGAVDAPITVGFEFIMHSLQENKNVRLKEEKQIFKSGSAGWGWAKFCIWNDILNTIDGSLPNDSLTVECRIWKFIDERIPTLPSPVSGDPYFEFSDSSLQKEMLSTAVRDEVLGFTAAFASTEYRACTYIRVDKKSILWPIGRVRALRPYQRLSIPVVTANSSAASFAMTIYLSGESVDNQRVEIEIRINESNMEKVCFVRCRIAALNGSMKTQHTSEDEHFFEPMKKNDVWKFPTFLQMSSLMEEKYLDATEGTLILRCKFAFSIQGNEFHIEGTDSEPLLSQFLKPVKEEVNDVQSMCKQMYKEKEFSDVALRMGGRTFKAHKGILAARSPVFRAMFETDMREKESGIVDITDYEPDTVEQLLTFIYTSNLDDLEQNKAVKLYSIADKYEVLSLKYRCSYHLMSTLSPSNVFEVLTLADLHQDGDLLDHVIRYIQLNCTAILNSQMWKDLMQSNGSLASRVMLHLLTRQVEYL